jgi:flavodoxin I
MQKIGIFFGTDSGTTRLIAKKIARAIKAKSDVDVVDKPVNVNRIDVAQLLAYDALILGTPTYGDGLLPGKKNGTDEESWSEFLLQLNDKDFSGVRVALYGLGDQEGYPAHFLDGMGHLFDFFTQKGATLVGGCEVEGYDFKQSKAVRGGRFIGLALDQHLQHLLTEQRIDTWLDEVLPLLLERSEEKVVV